MDTRQATAQLRTFLSMQPPEVRSELQVVTPASLGTPYLLHLSKNTDLKRFVPSLSRRGMRGENRTMARVCTASSMVGCLLGYVSDLFDFHDRQPGASVDGKDVTAFKGGYSIYGFKFDIALRPSSKLVPDVACTDEHWLVAFDSNHVAYDSFEIARMFYNSVRYEIVAGKQRTTIEMFIEVRHPDGLWFDGRTHLDKGFWKVVVQDLHNSKSWNDVRRYTPQLIDRNLYVDVKRNVAPTLSFESLAPPSAAW